MSAGGDEPAGSTRERLIDAAVRLFGERGIEATSLRALTESARTNIAAVNYHFGSKDGLLRAVIDRAMRPVNDERRRRLDELEARPRPPSAADLVRAFVEPGAGLADRADVARFLGRVLGEPDPKVRQLFADQVDPVEGRYLTALARALPELGDADVRFAYTSMVGLLGLHQSGTFATVDWPQRLDPGQDRSGAADLERLVAFIVGGILAMIPARRSADR
ncbi:TetR family transcriptional regulator [Pseudonocardia sp. DSM 110487]|uniref:TetR/AcrR family transcriptional regulator n=1 Tax=Pseudonocardia sp. DSM 110487 TaxID=2865833 RepID=UPI001C6A7E35|nr:TetR family transcriptional regulator [Pseudonocardia sp. DSM 110487]QYN33099.1 TetR family transcriptional regulator [Pseudonocardia sp. DSM 110487]